MPPVKSGAAPAARTASVGALRFFPGLLVSRLQGRKRSSVKLNDDPGYALPAVCFAIAHVEQHDNYCSIRGSQNHRRADCAS